MLRPDHEEDLIRYSGAEKILARGAGLSYSDSCFNENGYIIDTSRLNHFLSFDPETGIVVCQGGVPFKDLFLLHPEYIPPVIPGTLHATVAGGVAHDVHGKNNPHAGSFGQHIIWFDLLNKGKVIHCNREKNSELFYATLAGLGLTGIITRLALGLKKASRFVQVQNIKFLSLNELISYMSEQGIQYDYQVAWLDLLNNNPKAILSLANHSEPETVKERPTLKVPTLPIGLIKDWNMALFNRLYYQYKKPSEFLSLEQFNNPLDKLQYWNRLYGPKGLIQFQAVFATQNANETLEHLMQLIKRYKATPTLSVFKLFTQSGEGMLSFCKPGFTLAIDFIHNPAAKTAIAAMNQYVNEINGKVYLAKDLLLTPTQFKNMYEQHGQFTDVLSKLENSIGSDLSKRLGITQ